MKFTKEQIEKAKAAKSVEELLAFAKEAGYPLTEEEAKKYFEQWHKEGELADEELSNVAGGTCYSSGVWGPNGYQKYAIVTTENTCGWFGPPEGEEWPEPYRYRCCNCKHCFSVSATLYCDMRTEDNDPIQ